MSCLYDQTPTTTFPALGLPAALLRATEQLGFVAPTPIQASAIPLIAAGADLAVEAPTGSGKTAAYALPLLAALLAAPKPPGNPLVLVLVPTRELALQVAQNLRELSCFAPEPVSILAVIGGEAYPAQLAALDDGVHVLVATPGRLLDLLERDALWLHAVQTLVLDEADKLLDEGFREALAPLLAALPAKRQTLLFTATLPPKVRALADRLLTDATTLRATPTLEPLAEITQRVIEVDAERRRPLLQHLLASEAWPQTLVFVATQRAAHNLAVKLNAAGFSAVALHGDLDQAARVAALRRFTDHRVSVLVATDLAARGLHIPSLPAVINYDLPRAATDYQHRIGRTGRAGALGVAISFIDHASADHFRLIEKRCGVALVREQLADFPLTGAPPARTKGAPPTKGRRPSKKDKLRAHAPVAGAE